MTRRTNAKIAGAALLLYIVTGIGNMVMMRGVGGSGTMEIIASMAQHMTLIRIDVLHSLLEATYAMVLGVTMYALTRDEDRELAIIAMICRVVEGVISVLASPKPLAVMWLATGNHDQTAVREIGGLLLRSGGWTMLLAGSCFAVGSLIFSYLFLRSRSIPVALAWIGVVASALLVVVLPLQLAGFVTGSMLVWIPMIFFEVPLGLWLIVKGAEPRVTR